MGEQFFNNTSSCIIKLITLLIYQIILNPAQAPLANPCRWPPRRQIGAIHLINAVGVGSKWLTLVMCLWGGGGVLVLDRVPVLFLPYNKTYGVGVFCSFPNPNRGYPV